MNGKIIRVSGSLVVAKGLTEAKMFNLCLVGKPKLMGEIIKIKEELTFIQVYEDTMGISVGEEVVDTEMPLSVELGPGLLSSIYDGVQRPLVALEKACGSFIGRGVTASGLSRESRWHFRPKVKKGDSVFHVHIFQFAFALAHFFNNVARVFFRNFNPDIFRWL